MINLNLKRTTAIPAPDRYISPKWRAAFDAWAELPERALPEPLQDDLDGIVEPANGDMFRVAEAVNKYVNAFIEYERDGRIDDWSEPGEVFASRRGDCEEYAMMKYALMKAAGFPVEDMALMVVDDLIMRRQHAYLAIRVPVEKGANRKDIYFMDNRVPGLVDPKRPAVLPRFSLMEGQVYIHGWNS